MGTPGLEPRTPAVTAKARVITLLSTYGSRFLLCYFVLFAVPAPGRFGIFDAVPDSSYLLKRVISAWRVVVPWVAEHVFHMSAQAAKLTQAGGDRASSYVQVAIVAAIAAIVAVIWCLATPVGMRSSRSHLWLRALVRAYLFVALFAFGMNKIIPLQFPVPLFSRLVQPLGSLTPAALLWAFMGTSTAYQVLSGIVELAAAALLLFRRTTALGAVLMTAAMLNVVALNYCYDVGVKLYSSHLLAMSLFLMLPYVRQLADLFLFHRSAYIPCEPPLFPPGRLRTCALAVTVALAGWFTVTTTVTYWGWYQKVLSWRTNTPLWGLYDVRSFISNGQVLAVTNLAYWRGVYMQSPTSFSFQREDGAWDWYLAVNHPDTQTILLKDRESKRQIGLLTYSRPDNSHVSLRGKLNGSEVLLELQTANTARTRLVTNGFHWIHETQPSSE